MKKETSVIIGFISILVIVLLSIVIERLISFSKLKTITNNPFNTVEILNEKVRLNENERTYQLEIDCSTLTDTNTQIIYYSLKKKYQSYKITVSTKVFSNNTLLTTDYKNVTELDTNISIFDPKDKYEQVLHFNAKCKIE